MDTEAFFMQLNAGDRRKSFTILLKGLFPECALLMKSKTGIINRRELLGIFHEAFLYFCEKYASREFTLLNEASFVNYIKTACVFKAREYRRMLNGKGFPLRPGIIESYRDEFRECIEEARSEEYGLIRSRYGIDPAAIDPVPDPEPDRHLAVVSAFHKLSERCKLLIILKHLAKLSHHQIVEALKMFYTIKNENVSKTELQRCMAALGRRAKTQLTFG